MSDPHVEDTTEELLRRHQQAALGLREAAADPSFDAEQVRSLADYESRLRLERIRRAVVREP